MNSMPMIIVILTCLFSVVLMVHLHAEITRNLRMRHISKPFLMPVLACIYSSGASHPNLLIICALLLGTAGDIFMMFSARKKWFLAGALTFLIGHFCYIAAFVSSSGDLSDLRWIYILLAVPPGLILFGWCLPKILGRMGRLEIPLIFYGIVLFIMSSSLLLRSTQFSGCSFWLPYAGGVLFALSDSLIVVDRFHEKITNAKVYTMLTYALGQFFIVAGLMPAG